MDEKNRKILIIEDLQIDIELMQKVLRNKYQVIPAYNRQEGIDKAITEQPDIILLDIMMDGMDDGYEVCDTLKKCEATRDIPIIFVSARVEVGDKVRGFNLGADDYITKPFDLEELSARVDAAMRIKNRQDELHAMSITDALTGLPNRRYLMDRLEEEVARAERYEYPLSCLMLDLDRFKLVNDQFGHQTGDVVLKELAQLLIENIRMVDIVARYGGEEFVIILPNTGLNARILAERIRRSVEQYAFAEALNLKLTISIGYSILNVHHSFDGFELINRADIALYKAKKDRNAVASYE